MDVDTFICVAWGDNAKIVWKPVVDIRDKNISLNDGVFVQVWYEYSMFFELLYQQKNTFIIHIW